MSTFLHFMHLAYLTAEVTRTISTVTSFCDNSVRRLSVLTGGGDSRGSDSSISESNCAELK